LSNCIIQLGNFFLQKHVPQILESLRAHHSLEKLLVFEIRAHPGDQNQEHEYYCVEGNVTCQLIARVERKKDVDAAEHDEQKNNAEKVRNGDCVQLEQSVCFVCVLFLNFFIFEILRFCLTLTKLLRCALSSSTEDLRGPFSSSFSFASSINAAIFFFFIDCL